MSPPDLLYVSPHLDDAVFSAGGSIALAARAGRRVAVLTAFSHGEGEAKRREEDAAALALLGAERIDLRLPEAPLRDRACRRPAALFRPLEVDEEGVAPLVASLQRAILSLGGSEIVGPLGVGRHADHQIAHLACAHLPDDRRVAFYEDLPYALCAYQSARRLTEIGAVTDEPIGSAVGAFLALARAWYERPVLRAVAPPGLAPLAAAMVARTVLQGGRLPAHPPTLIEERTDIREVLDDKLAAIAAYASQWPLFHATLDGWRAALEAHAQRIGAPGPVERRWRQVNRSG